MGLSNTYGAANDEESKNVLRHAIKIGQVGISDHPSNKVSNSVKRLRICRLSGIREMKSISISYLIVCLMTTHIALICMDAAISECLVPRIFICVTHLLFLRGFAVKN